jgi:PAS domain S-box-containing protein
LLRVDAGRWLPPELQARLKGEQTSFEEQRVEILLPRQGRRFFMTSARPIDHTPWLLVAFRDVTEQALLEQALQTSEIEFRKVFAAAPAGISMVNSAGTIAFVNRMLAQQFGYEMDELLGSSIERLVPDTSRAVHAQHRAEYALAPGPRLMGRGRQLLGRRKDGSEFPVEVALNVISRGSETLTVAFTSDLSERVQGERRIRDYQARLQQMAFDAALTEERERRRIAADLHDHLGQTLVLAQLKLTAARQSNPDAMRRALEETLPLLEQSIAETRTLTFDLSPPILYDLGLKEAISWLAEQLERMHGLRIELSVDGVESGLGAEGNAVVYRAVRELLTNVFKHAKHPSARVTLEAKDNTLCVSVEDQGIGFHLTTLQQAESQGFGLMNVQEQIKRLGGNVEIQSAPNQGTRVTMSLPLVTTAARE